MKTKKNPYYSNAVQAHPSTHTPPSFSHNPSCPPQSTFQNHGNRPSIPLHPHTRTQNTQVGTPSPRLLLPSLLLGSPQPPPITASPSPFFFSHPPFPPSSSPSPRSRLCRRPIHTTYACVGRVGVWGPDPIIVGLWCRLRILFFFLFFFRGGLHKKSYMQEESLLPWRGQKS